MTRGPKGQGVVTLLPNGKWLVKVPVGPTGSGKTRYVSRTTASKSEANKERRLLIQERENQRLVAGPRVTFKNYALEVLFNQNDKASERTLDGYLRSMRCFVFPVLGSRVLSEIRPRDIEALLGEIRKKYSASTVNNVRTALSKIFSQAELHELVHNNPVRRTKKAHRAPFEKTQVRVPWSKEEMRRALQAASGTSMEPILTLLLSTGMRRGELIGLRWSDLDFDRGTLVIQRTIHRQSIIQPDGSVIGRVVVGPPKTAFSMRVNHLSPPVLDVLRRHQLEQEVLRSSCIEQWDDGDYIFANAVGKPLDGSKLHKQYTQFLREHELRHVRIHDLRHTFATVLIEEDSGQLAAVSRTLGHSSIAITMDTYARTSRVESQATELMSKILFPDRIHQEISKERHELERYSSFMIQRKS